VHAATNQLPVQHAGPALHVRRIDATVTEATIRKTICRPGCSDSVRPATSVTSLEKPASICAWGCHQASGNCEYDHLISLELGAAANDGRSLWPENGRWPRKARSRATSIRTCATAARHSGGQRVIALDWASFYNRNLKPRPKLSLQPLPASPPGPSSPAGEGIVDPSAFCSPQGATGHTSAGTRMACEPASDGAIADSTAEPGTHMVSTDSGYRRPMTAEAARGRLVPC
jgi:hypothetical protein